VYILGDSKDRGQLSFEAIRCDILLKSGWIRRQLFDTSCKKDIIASSAGRPGISSRNQDAFTVVIEVDREP
jgi:hypothetical protein